MYGIELNDEQLEMVAGGSTAAAGAAGGQGTAITTGSTISGGSLVYSAQVVGAAADAHDIAGSFTGNTLTSQTASGAGDFQIA